MTANNRARILIIDDECDNQDIISRYLEAMGHQTVCASDGVEALVKVNLGIDLVLCDIRMPNLDGFEVLAKIRQEHDPTSLPIIMVTGMSGTDERLRAASLGANDFVSKPVDKTELSIRVDAQLRLRALHNAVREKALALEAEVDKRTQQLELSLDDVIAAKRDADSAHHDTIYRLATAAEYKDEETGEHIHRMSRYTGVLAEHMALPASEAHNLTVASVLHDVGKIGIPDRILLKPGSFTPEEWVIMKEHTTIGSRILGGSGSDLLSMGEVIALSHHEKWNGSGYPKGLRENEIPLPGRICAVSDAFDAITTRRPYKDAIAPEEAFAMIEADRGTHFDPELVDVLKGCKSEFVAIYSESSS